MKKGTQYDIIVKNGLLIDPQQRIHEKKDIAIMDRKVAAVEPSIPTTQAKKTIDASDMIVTPGLIDLHTHCTYGIVHLAIDPESICLQRGTTTAIDAGSLGHLQFPAFRKYLVKTTKAKLYALLNIESLGMVEFAKNEKWPELITGKDEVFINVDETVKTIQENRDLILGIKWAHHGLTGVKLARNAADKAKCLVMAENHIQPETIKLLKKGDIITHLYHGLRSRPHDGLLNDEGKVQPEFFDAIRRGVIMDIGHGRGSFSWDVARTTLEQGIRPDTISTDLHINSYSGPAYDMPTTMSKLLHLGLPLEEVVRASTTKPAEVISKQNEVGTLAPGANADVTILKLQEGKFPLTDTLDQTRIAERRLNLVKVISNGSIV